MQLVPWSDLALVDIHAVVRAIQISDGHPFPAALSELEEEQEEPHFDPSKDAVAAVDGGGIVGWAKLFHEPSGERQERVLASGGTVPDRRGEGIGSQLVEWQVERARQLVAGYDHGLAAYLRTFEYTSQPGSAQLFEDHGMRPVRWYRELIRGLSPVVADTSAEIVPWDPARAEEARTTHNEAFADHWGSTVVDATAWAAWNSMPSTRHDLSWMALDGGALVGYTLNSFYPDDGATTGRRDGWIGSLGVMASHRKQGIASALIARSIDAFRDSGMTHAFLGVDSANQTGAHGLYERLGFEPIHQLVTHEIRVG